jgi:hypothetical protein
LSQYDTLSAEALVDRGGGSRRQPAHRGGLNDHDLYREARIPGLEQTGLIAPGSWIPDSPVPLDDVVHNLQADAAHAPITGSERESSQMRPLLSDQQRFQRYSHAVQFGVMDINEALAHETALHHLARDAAGDISVCRPSWRNLAFRRLFGGPFDLSRRPLLGVIGTVTIRAAESPSMIIHQRDGGGVAGGGGVTHLLPPGISNRAA